MITLKNIKNGCSIGKAYSIFFLFRPWDGKVEKHVNEVNIEKVELTPDGEIYCEFKTPDEIKKRYCIGDSCGMYYGKIKSGITGWCGVFDTKNEALQAYDETIAQWIDNM